jgi:hypothetical protein
VQPAVAVLAPAPVTPGPAEFSNLGDGERAQKPARTPQPEDQHPELGRPDQEFLPRRWWLWLSVSAVLMVAAIVALILAQGSRNKVVAVPAAIIAIPNSGLLVLLIIFTIMSVKRRVVLCENGLFIQGLSRTSVCLWDDVVEVYFQMIGIAFGRGVSVRTREGKQIGVPMAVRPLFQLYLLICEKTAPRLLPPIQQALDQGLEIEFGEYIKLTPRGLYWDGKTLPWGQVTNVSWGFLMHIKRSALSVSADQSVGPIDTTLIPNVVLLLDLLEKRYRIKVERATKFFE